MKKIVFALLTITLATAMTACKSKPTGSEYLGTWTGTVVANGLETQFPCKLQISKVNESFLLDAEKNACSFANGLYVLTPEGNLISASGRGGASLAFDLSSKQIVFSYPTIKLAHLTKAV